MMKNGKIIRIIVTALTVCSILLLSLSIQAVDTSFGWDNREKSEWNDKVNEKSWEEKIDAELWEFMARKSGDDLIPVYIWIKNIDHNVITAGMNKEYI